MRATVSRIVLSSMFATVLAYGLSSCGTGDSGEGPDASTNQLDGGSTENSDGGTPDAGPEPESCKDAPKLVYVLSDANDLYRFDPQAKEFSKVGNLSACIDGVVTVPNPMAVDRKGVAWVNAVEFDPFSGSARAGSIVKVGTSDASCERTAVQLSAGWRALGMAFAANPAVGPDEETLYVSGSDGLGRIDLVREKVVPIAALGSPMTGEDAALTGTRAGQLFGFFASGVPKIAEIDPSTAAIKGAPETLATVAQPDAWALAQWGGALYLFTRPAGSPGTTTSVTKYDRAHQTVDASFMTEIGFTVVGAASSTCAPL